jgi:hypothetical protein
MYSGGRNEYNFARNFVLSKIFLMIVWIVSSDLNFSPNTKHLKLSTVKFICEIPYREILAPLWCHVYSKIAMSSKPLPNISNDCR